ncbi:MAG: hypothetical protein KC503_12535 [Myxococcales bacterium]|nr:hypothetical protein [Myxococcales bacterium]
MDCSRVATIIAVALLASVGCAHSSVELAAKGRLGEACAAAPTYGWRDVNKRSETASVLRALRQRTRVQIALHAYTPDEIKAQVGTIPVRLASESLLLRLTVTPRALPGASVSVSVSRMRVGDQLYRDGWPADVADLYQVPERIKHVYLKGGAQIAHLLERLFRGAAARASKALLGRNFVPPLKDVTVVIPGRADAEQTVRATRSRLEALARDRKSAERRRCAVGQRCSWLELLTREAYRSTGHAIMPSQTLRIDVAYHFGKTRCLLADRYLVTIANGGAMLAERINTTLGAARSLSALAGRGEKGGACLSTSGVARHCAPGLSCREGRCRAGAR